MNYNNKTNVQIVIDYIKSKAIKTDNTYKFQELTYTEEELELEQFTKNNDDQEYLLAKVKEGQVSRLRYMSNELCENKSFALKCLVYARCLNYFSPLLQKDRELELLDYYHIRHSLTQAKIEKLLTDINNKKHSREFFDALIELDPYVFMYIYKNCDEDLRLKAIQLNHLNALYSNNPLSRNDYLRLINSYAELIIAVPGMYLTDVTFLLDAYYKNKEVQKFCNINLEYYALHDHREKERETNQN